jgi:hypothetical protein
MTEPLEGLLCFDNNPKIDWRDKVRDAAQRFQSRFGVMPDLCHLNAATCYSPDAPLEGDSLVEAVDGIEVYTRLDIPRNHFFVAGRNQRLTGVQKSVKKTKPKPALESHADVTVEQPSLFNLG